MTTPLIPSQTGGPSSIPGKQHIPNNQSSVPNGMPFKPNTMTQGSFFSMSRAAYRAKVNQNVLDVGQAPKKKWYGVSGSRTSSEHTNLKGIQSTGKESLNQINTKTFSFSGPDQTSIKSALTRCRGGGCIAPKKKGAH